MTLVVSIDFRMSPELRVNLSSPSWAGVTSKSTSFGAAVSAAESVVVDRRCDAVVVRAWLVAEQLGTLDTWLRCSWIDQV